MKLEVPSSQAEAVSLNGKAEIYLVYNSPLEELLFDRGMIELPFRSACLQASRLFLRHVADELSSVDVAELLILSKGVVYQLEEAFAQELGRNLPVNFIATKRLKVDNYGAKIDVAYARFDAGGRVLIIGDTVASGSTIIAALEEYRKAQTVDAVYLISYAGSVVGAQRLVEYCSARNIGLTILFGLAAFGLGDNGFDLSFLHPDTITRPEYINRARRIFFNRQVSAVGWDFGAQTLAPNKYRALSWAESRFHGLEAGVLPEISEPESLESLSNERDAFGHAIKPIRSKEV